MAQQITEKILITYIILIYNEQINHFLYYGLLGIRSDKDINLSIVSR